MASAAAAASAAPAGAILLSAQNLQEVWDSLLGNDDFFRALYLDPKILSVKPTTGGGGGGGGGSGGGGVKTPLGIPEPRPNPVSRPTTGLKPDDPSQLIDAVEFRNTYILGPIRPKSLTTKYYQMLSTPVGQTFTTSKGNKAGIWNVQRDNPFEDWKDYNAGKGAEVFMSKEGKKFVKLKPEYNELRSAMSDPSVNASFQFYLPQWHDAFSMLTEQGGEWRIDPTKMNAHADDGDGDGGDGGDGDGGDDLTPPAQNAQNAQNASSNGTSQTTVRAELESKFKDEQVLVSNAKGEHRWKGIKTYKVTGLKQMTKQGLVDLVEQFPEGHGLNTKKDMEKLKYDVWNYIHSNGPSSAAAPAADDDDDTLLSALADSGGKQNAIDLPDLDPLIVRLLEQDKNLLTPKMASSVNDYLNSGNGKYGTEAGSRELLWKKDDLNPKQKLKDLYKITHDDKGVLNDLGREVFKRLPNWKTLIEKLEKTRQDVAESTDRSLRSNAIAGKDGGTGASSRRRS